MFDSCVRGAGHITADFVEDCLLYGLKSSCQHTHFLMRPNVNVCVFQKISKSEKRIRDAGVLGWGKPILPIFFKTKGTASGAVKSCHFVLACDVKVKR